MHKIPASTTKFFSSQNKQVHQAGSALFSSDLSLQHSLSCLSMQVVSIPCKMHAHCKTALSVWFCHDKNKKQKLKLDSMTAQTQYNFLYKDLQNSWKFTIWSGPITKSQSCHLLYQKSELNQYPPNLNSHILSEEDQTPDVHHTCISCAHFVS